MDNAELLRAIKAHIDERMDRLESRMDRLESRMDKLEESMDALESRVDELVVRMDKLEVRMGKLEDRVADLEDRVELIERNVRRTADNIVSLDEHVKKIQVTLDVDVSPRMRTIEDCYMSTYKRYKEECNQITNIVLDIEVLQKTVHGHSIQLQMIS